MKVKELISALGQLNPEAEVVAQSGYEYFPIEPPVAKQAYIDSLGYLAVNVEWPEDWERIEVVKLSKSRTSQINVSQPH